jgi:hypothetical protein
MDTVIQEGGLYVYNMHNILEKHFSISIESAVKPLVPAAFAVVSTHQSALGPRGGLWPVLLVRNP